MRVISMHKTNASNEAGIPPSLELIAGMGELMGELVKTGILRSGGGLRASSLGVRLNFSGGKRTITNGPFTGGNELTAGFRIINVKSLDDAIEWATRFADVIGDVEIDIRPLCEPWDLGVCPKPEGLETTRFMLVHKADKHSEAGVLPDQAQIADLKKLTDDMVKAGVFQEAEELRPSSKGVRLRFSGGKQTVIDGPFAESKELIAGFVIHEVNSIDESIAWAPPFAKLIGDVEIDIRPLYEPSDLA